MSTPDTPSANIVAESRHPPGPLGHVSVAVNGTVSVTVGGSWPPPGEAAGSVVASDAFVTAAADTARDALPLAEPTPAGPTSGAADVPAPEIWGTEEVRAGDIGGETGPATADAAADEGGTSVTVGAVAATVTSDGAAAEASVARAESLDPWVVEAGDAAATCAEAPPPAGSAAAGDAGGR
jgi:hypothetical protein